MVNHVTMPDVFCKGTAISPDDVAVSFSKKEDRDPLKACAEKEEEKRTDREKEHAQFYNNMVAVETSIMENNLIPDKCRLWISTSRNKEGISIKSKDINDLFVESHNISDIKQMAGRVRHGVENLYIIVDSSGYHTETFMDDEEYTRKYIAPDVRKISEDTNLSQWSTNAHLEKICNRKNIPDFYGNPDSEFRPYRDKNSAVKNWIESVLNRYPYAQFDFFRNHFCYYYLKEAANRYEQEQHRLFRKASEDHAKYVRIFQRVFPKATVHPYMTREQQMREYIENLIRDDPKRTFSTEEIKHHIAALNKILFDDPKYYLKKANKLLKYAGYRIRRGAKEFRKPAYNRWRFYRLEEA